MSQPDELDATMLTLHTLVANGAWRSITLPGAVGWVRLWPDGFTDTLVLRGADIARADRTNPDHHVVWSTNGTADAVLGALHGLPPPGSPHAPRVALPRHDGARNSGET